MGEARHKTAPSVAPVLPKYRKTAPSHILRKWYLFQRVGRRLFSKRSLDCRSSIHPSHEANSHELKDKKRSAKFAVGAQIQDNTVQSGPGSRAAGSIVSLVPAVWAETRASRAGAVLGSVCLSPRLSAPRRRTPPQRQARHWQSATSSAQ